MSSIAPPSEQPSDVAMPQRHATTYVDAKAIRCAVLAALTSCERVLLWRWCIGSAALYAVIATLLSLKIGFVL